jgi:predicted Fe-Mo cluster-binding NifX family protein
MKIAIPAQEQVKGSELSPVFGRARYFFVFDQDNGKYEFVENQATQRPGGAGVQAAQLLVDQGVQVLITPQCGDKAQQVLKSANIALYRSLDDSLEGNIKAFLDRELSVLTGEQQ